MRPRPEDVRLLLPTPPFPSFPSGHAAGAFATAMVVALVYRQRKWRVAAFVGAFLIAYSRLYLGHHFPSDLFGGAVLGVAAGAGCYGMRRREDSLATRLGWLVWLQIAIAILVTQMAYLDLLPQHLLRWPYADKVMHFVLFGAITFWLNLWLGGRRIQWGRLGIPLAIIVPITLAALEEVAQMLSPLRTASGADLAFDLMGMWVCWWLSERLLVMPDKSRSEVGQQQIKSRIGF